MFYIFGRELQHNSNSLNVAVATNLGQVLLFATSQMAGFTNGVILCTLILEDDKEETDELLSFLGS